MGMPVAAASDEVDPREEVQRLLDALRHARPELKRLAEYCDSHWGYEDPIYRFYHQSFKIYGLQDTTRRIVAALQAAAPERQLNEWFMAIVSQGTDRHFKPEHNQNWLEETRPIVEAFFHARYFLEMAVRYGEQLSRPPKTLPSGWAALLEFYGLR